MSVQHLKFTEFSQILFSFPKTFPKSHKIHSKFIEFQTIEPKTVLQYLTTLQIYSKFFFLFSGNLCKI